MDPLYTSAALCHIRSFIPSGIKWFGEFHQDNRLYNSDAEILTLWFPFRYQHGPMPSLEFLPFRSKSHLPCVSVCGIDNEMFEPGVFWRPAYELGDAMLLSGFVPHRTYVETDMTLERTSVDFRFFASAVPSPIFPPERTPHHSPELRPKPPEWRPHHSPELPPKLIRTLKRFVPIPVKQRVKTLLGR
jgi:hypothetical protein